jgi:(E)-4-hydroxy-3-methyl-but-2-enyl pyrophosphate reductase
MKIVVAKTAGFCMGVRRAVELGIDAGNRHEGPICTFGPLIHNPQVLDLLEEKGISVIDDIPRQGSGTVLIRAHGVPPWVRQKLKASGFKVMDATCPRVIKVQSIIRKHSRQGYAIIIIGDRDHPEVKGLLGYAGQNGHVAETIEQLEGLPVFDKAIIVAQTTQNTGFFDQVKSVAATRFAHYQIFDTICDSTEKRQFEVKRLAALVDAVIVVGGHNSGNTKRLAEIAAETGKPAFHIETEAELDPKALAGFKSLGITAGASTPNWIIKRVYRAIETLPGATGTSLGNLLFSIQRALLLTSLYVSIGAAALCYAASRLQAIPDPRAFMLISMLYVLSMHLFNNLTGIKADRYNDPDRAELYKNHRLALSVMAAIAGGAGLVTAYTMGNLPFLILLAMSLLGLLYNVKLLPENMPGFRARKIKDIPGSKTLLITVAWGLVTVIFPPVAARGSVSFGGLCALIWVMGMVFVRTAFFDILDMQGDRIVGKETIPILLGEKKTLRLLKIILVCCVAVLVLGAMFGLLPGFSLALCLCPVALFVVLTAHQRGFMLPGIKLEFLVESHFVAAGLILLVLSALTT